MACQGIKINRILNLTLLWYDSRDFPGLQASNFPSLTVAFSNSRSLPVRREGDFQFPFPFPGAKKPFSLTSDVQSDINKSTALRQLFQYSFGVQQNKVAGKWIDNRQFANFHN